MVVCNIISKMNSTFGTTGKATTNKLTETVDGKDSSFRFCVKNIIWTTCGHGEARLQNLEFFLLSPHREWNFISIELPVTFLPFNCLYLWILEIKSEQYFYTLDLISAYLIYGDFPGLFV